MANITLTELTKRFLLTPKKLSILAKRLMQIPKNRIANNKTPGRALKRRTVQDKKRRGSSTPDTKLSDTKELLQDITYNISKNIIKVGSTNKLHKLKKRTTNKRWKKRQARNQRIEMFRLMRIHSKGLGNNPERPPLFTKNEQPYKEELLVIDKFFKDLFEGRI